MSIFKHAYDIMQKQNQSILEKSLMDCHAKGLFSLVINCNSRNELTRVFIATQDIEFGDIALHSHTYPLSIGVVKGNFVNHKAVNTDDLHHGMLDMFDWVQLDSYDYSSAITGSGELQFVETNHYCISASPVPKGGVFYLNADEIHTVSVKKGTIWIVSEYEKESGKNVVLGMPFSTKGLYNKPSHRQIDEMWNLVYNELKAMFGGDK